MESESDEDEALLETLLLGSQGIVTLTYFFDDF